MLPDSAFSSFIHLVGSKTFEEGKGLRAGVRSFGYSVASNSLACITSHCKVPSAGHQISTADDALCIGTGL